MKYPSEMSIREIEEYLDSSYTTNFVELCIHDARVGVRRLAQRFSKYHEELKLEQARIDCMLGEEKRLWEQGFLLVAGIDEAGRGPLAGPVVAGVCILPAKFELLGLNDSKQLTEKKRESLYTAIKDQAIACSVGTAEPAEIDVLNIYQATRLAMKRAVEGLKVRPHYLILDGNATIDVKIPQTALVGGDGLSASIAAASILAKVTRDKWMQELHELYPEYGFANNKGYGTKEHLQALRQIGPSPIHRKSFAPVVEHTAG